MENTIEFNTPTDIEKDFSDFFDGERIDACDVIESILHSEEAEEEGIDVEIYYQRLACIIFVVRCLFPQSLTLNRNGDEKTNTANKQANKRKGYLRYSGKKCEEKGNNAIIIT